MTLSFNYDGANASYNPASTSENASLYHPSISQNGGTARMTEQSRSITACTPFKGGATINSSIEHTLERS